MRVLFLIRCGKEGIGHLTRCKAISQALISYKVDSYFIINSKSGLQYLNNHQIIDCFDWYNNKKKLEKYLINYKNIFVDTLSIKYSLLQLIKKKSINFWYIDDFKRWKHSSGTIIDWTINAKKRKYSSKVNYLFGSKYTCLRKAFWSRREKFISKNINHVLVSFSGDNRNLSKKVIEIILKYDPNIKVSVVISSLKNNKKKSLFRSNKVKTYYRIDEKEIRELMYSADIAITSGGQTLYELASVGTPTIGILSYKNQKEDTEGFQAVGFLCNIGNWNSKTLESKIIKTLQTISLRNIRLKMSQVGRNTIDGLGALRIAKNISGFKN
jgi:UDP-2,4-diacetamido-2,4,6-trideoxy-beta-L-altropyranose hydrolase